MKSLTNFPVGIPSLWSNLNAVQISQPILKNWLMDSGSLTERLVARCETFHLTLLGQDNVSITEDEFQQVCAEGQGFQERDWQVREVILWGDAQPWVFARSIIPMALWQRDFSDLTDKPLGQLIFNDNRFKRMPFQLTQIQDPKGFLQQFDLNSSVPLWGRRSTFVFEDLKMMVCEIFLPSSPAYLTME